MRNQTCLLATVVSAVLFASTAGADDRAAARPLFDEGKELMKAGKVAEACLKFEAASHLTSTAGVRLNLAGCWARLGRTASAWGMYDEARAIADRSGDVAAGELAQKGKAELEPRLSRLLVHVEGANVAGLEVTRDGEPVFSGAWGVGVPVDPGDHEVAAKAPGHKGWSTKKTVTGDGALVTVNVPVLEVEQAAPVAAGAAPLPSGQQAVQSGTGTAASEGPKTAAPFLNTQRIIGLVAAGVGVVAVGVGAGFGVAAMGDRNNYKALEPNGTCINLACQTDSQSAVSAGNTSTVFFVAGGVLVAAGAVVWLTAPKTSESGVSAKLVPSLSARTGGLSLEGSW